MDRRKRQDRFIQEVLAVLRNAKAAGVVVDWQQIDPAYKKDLTAFIDKFADALHDDNKELWLCVQPGQELDYIDIDALSDNIDRFVAMLFDETSETDPPGPLASRSWFEGWLHVLLDGSDTKQWIIAIGSYGYDWPIGGKKGELISFSEAMSRANDAEIKSVQVQGPSYSPYFYFQDEDTEHGVWFLDAVTFLNELRAVRDEKAGGFALYRLGSEDPAIWDALNVPRDFKFDNQTRQALELIKSTDTITDVGDGEIVTVDEDRTDGMRKLAVDADGYLTAKYVKFAEFPTLYHQGAGGEHQVAITFDDGPDPRWTPKILDILKAANVKATFFVVGVNAERYPALVRRIVNEGHEIGNHTYYHPNLALCWPEHIRLELNATQLLLETITGRATTLFRPPYAADTGPTELSELIPLKIAEDLNYLVVLENIDPQDWAKPGADIILRRIKQQRHDGSVILLHDAGGDRSQTVEALPRILDWLHTRGDTIVPLSTLLGTTRDAVMPPVQGNGQSLTRLVSSTGFRVYHSIEEFLWAFMIVATALVVVRTLIVIWLAARFRRRPRTNFAEPISVVIAAYNEEKLIAETLRTLLATDYKGEIEVIVVDDGSTDQTAAEVERIARNESRIRLFQQENRGKARALQRGLAAARNGIVVFIDADTQCQRDTLPRLLEPFADERIGAVSGHAKVGNLRTFIARCQALEYTCGFNLDRRAYNRWNCITVVPGAISAIRKDAIDEAGGLSLETLAEDTDLTLSLHRHRQRIVYVPDAIAWTEAPETVRDARATTFSLGLRHAAMSLETSRHGVQLELSRARLVQFAEHLVFPDHSRGHHADGGFVPAGLAAIRRVERGAAVRHHISCDGRAPRHARLYFGTRTNPARLAHFADAPDLSPDAQLLHLESNPARHQRRLGQLGQTRAHRQRAGASVITNLLCFGGARAVSHVCREGARLSEVSSVLRSGAFGNRKEESLCNPTALSSPVVMTGSSNKTPSL